MKKKLIKKLSFSILDLFLEEEKRNVLTYRMLSCKLQAEMTRYFDRYILRLHTQFFPRFWRVRSKPERWECQCKCSACRDAWSAVSFHVPGVQVLTFQLGGNSTRRSKTYTNWTIRAKPAGLARRPVLTTFSITRWQYNPALRSSAALRIDTPNPRGWRVRVNGAISNRVGNPAHLTFTSKIWLMAF
jgi:hypothetical protein